MSKKRIAVKAPKDNEKKQAKQFRWSPEMFKNLSNCLYGYKAEMQYKNIDFSSDKAAQHEPTRKVMAENYLHHSTLFGPFNITSFVEDDSSSEASILWMYRES